MISNPGLPKRVSILGTGKSNKSEQHLPATITEMQRALDPTFCAILVPVRGQIEPSCEASLRKLEERGYVVRRTFSRAPVDLLRIQMATEALTKGFEETMWIDPDID